MSVLHCSTSMTGGGSIVLAISRSSRSQSTLASIDRLASGNVQLKSLCLLELDSGNLSPPGTVRGTTSYHPLFLSMLADGVFAARPKSSISQATRNLVFPNRCRPCLSDCLTANQPSIQMMLCMYEKHEEAMSAHHLQPE